VQGQAIQAQGEREREVERCDWQQMLLGKHEALQQEAIGLQKTNVPSGNKQVWAIPGALQFQTVLVVYQAAYHIQSTELNSN
jgi:hypothetical protein